MLLGALHFFESIVSAPKRIKPSFVVRLRVQQENLDGERDTKVACQQGE